MRLKDFPRPHHDTGFGLHGSPDITLGPDGWDSWAPYIRDLGVSWYTLLTVGTNGVEGAVELLRNDITPIIRLYGHQPHPNQRVDGQVVKTYVNHNVNYFQIGNEPNLRMEWPAPYVGNKPLLTAEQYIDNASVILRNGGIPVTPPLAPGGDIFHRNFFEQFLSKIPPALLKESAVGVHNRPFNHPVDYVEDPHGFLEYRWFDKKVREYLGHSLPLLGTEAGYEPGWRQDDRYPRISDELHKEWNLKIIYGFENRWGPALFCQNFWVAFGPADGPFEGAYWWT